jgi:hypothetical protein
LIENHAGAAPGQPETQGLGPQQWSDEGAKSSYVTGLEKWKMEKCGYSRAHLRFCAVFLISSDDSS